MKPKDTPHTLADQLAKLQQQAKLVTDADEAITELERQLHARYIRKQQLEDQSDIDFALKSDQWKSSGEGQ